MNKGVTITSENSKGLKTSYEFWFHENFIAVHAHGFTDNEKIAKNAIRYRFIWGRWYYCYETFIPRFVFEKIVDSEECIKMFVDWFLEAEEE